MSAKSDTARPAVVSEGEALWFLGTFVRVKLDGRQTNGRLGVFEVVLPHGAAPPLHSHPQDETICVIEGRLTAWIVEPEALTGDHTDPPAWVSQRAHECGPGAMVYAPGHTPHTFRVESDTARVITLSTPAGIEELARTVRASALALVAATLRRSTREPRAHAGRRARARDGPPRTATPPALPST